MPIFLTIPHFDWKPILEFRARFERRTDRDFSRSNSDNRSDLFTRTRLGAAFSVDKVKGQVVYQYAHDEDWARGGNLAFWRSDILLGYGQVKLGEGTLTGGRQRFKYGSERLLGALDWNNITNSYDGARYSMGRFEVFAGKIAVNPFPNDELRLGGAAFDQGADQTLVVYKHDRRDEKVDEFTVSHQYRGKLGPVSVDAEAAGQFGHRDNRRKLAGAFDAQAAMPVAPKLTFLLQGSVASGGGDGRTDRSFDQLYPSGHDRHGLSDLTGWRNVRDLGVGLRYDVDKASSVKFQYHGLGLDSARDAWYGALGRPNARPGGQFRDPSGANGRDLGDEYDAEYTRKLNVHQTLKTGLALFQPGRFVRAFNGSTTKDQVFGYLQWSYIF